MEMIYDNDTLFVDLSGNVDVDQVRYKLFSVVGQYKIGNVIINITDVFNYKKKNYLELISDYSRVFKGNISIRKYWKYKYALLK